jgi:hypothetical protein
VGSHFWCEKENSTQTYKEVCVLYLYTREYVERFGRGWGCGSKLANWGNGEILFNSALFN